MAEYIEREAAIEAFDDPSVERYYGDVDPDSVIRVINSFPAADVRPVARGKWKPRDLTWGRSYYYCSACEETVDMPTAMGIPMFRYCPNCGADMRDAGNEKA